MMNLSIPLILSTFGIIIVAELPDKTAFATLLLATRYKPYAVIIGAWVAFLIQTIIAVFAGSIISIFPQGIVHVIAGAGFLLFSYLAFTRQEKEAMEEEKQIKLKKKSLPPVLISFLILFGAEWADLTQLATAALVARVGHPVSVGIGAVAGLWTVSLCAAIFGSRLGKLFSPQRLNVWSGILFLLIGIIILVTSFLR